MYLWKRFDEKRLRKGENKISIPPTLLFSLFGNHHDVRYTTTSDLKPGESLYLVGESKQELGASEISYMLSESGESMVLEEKFHVFRTQKRT